MEDTIHYEDFYAERLFYGKDYHPTPQEEAAGVARLPVYYQADCTFVWLLTQLLLLQYME